MVPEALAIEQLLQQPRGCPFRQRRGSAALGAWSGSLVIAFFRH